MDVLEVCDAIADLVRDPAIVGLNALGYHPPKPPVPCLFVASFEIDYDQAMENGFETLELTLRVLEPRGHGGDAQGLLKGLLASSGPKSVKAKLEAAKTLGGLVDDVHVRRMQGLGTYQYGEIEYLGAELLTDVMGS